MCGAECVHHVAVGIRGQFLGESLLALLHLFLCLVVFRVFLVDAHGLAFLLGVEAEVLEQQCLARLQGGHLGVGVGAVGCKLDFDAQGCRNILDNLRERKLFLHLAFGLAHVAHHDERAAVGQHLLQCGERAAYASLVRYVTILVQWHVEVHADNCLLAGKVELIDIHSCILI